MFPCLKSFELYNELSESCLWMLYITEAKQHFQSRTMTRLFNSNFIGRIIVLVTQKISVLLYFAAISVIFIFFLWSRNSPLCQHVSCQERGSPPAGSGPWPHLLTAPEVVEGITDSQTGQSMALQGRWFFCPDHIAVTLLILLTHLWLLEKALYTSISR